MKIMKTKKPTFFYIFLTLTTLIIMTSCNSETRTVKKFLGRLNAREINSSSKYLWPEDHNRLYIFNKRFLENNDLVSLEYIEGNSTTEGERTFVNAKIKCNNCDSSIINYFKTNNKYDGKYINEKFEIKKAHDVEYISVDWNWDSSKFSNNLKLCKDTIREIKFREEPSLNSEVSQTIAQNTDFIIDENYDENGWKKSLHIEENGNIKPLYFPSSSSNIKSDIHFFTLGWFGGLSILVLAVVAIICFVVVFPLLVVSSFKVLGGGEGPMQAGCFLFVLIMIVVAIGYEFLENLLFELFLVNLPL